MISEYIGFGNIILQLNLPQKTVGKHLYDTFFCEPQRPDFVINFDFTDAVLCPEKEQISFDTSDKSVEITQKSYRCYYKNRVGGGYYALSEQMIGSSQIDVSLDRSIKDKLWTRIILNTIGIESLAIQKGAVVFHSSFIEKEGRAVLFTGPCSIGKSTQAELWHQHRGKQIINGDKTYLYLEKGTVYASGLPFSGSSGICKNKAMPLDYMVKLEKGSVNEIQELSAKEAFFAVMNSCYVPYGFVAQSSEIAALIAESSRICRLSCLPDVSAVETLEKFMQKENEK